MRHAVHIPCTTIRTIVDCISVLLFTIVSRIVSVASDVSWLLSPFCRWNVGVGVMNGKWIRALLLLITSVDCKKGKCGKNKGKIC